MFTNYISEHYFFNLNSNHTSIRLYNICFLGEKYYEIIIITLGVCPDVSFPKN